MKKTAIISAIFLGASAFTLPALAQSGAPAVPGSDAVIDLNDAAQREGVAQEPGGAPATTGATPEQDTIVPGSDSQADLNRAEEREGVAAGTDATTTGSMTPETAPAGETILVPGSGATFSTPATDGTQQGDALQDESSTEAVQ